MRKILRFVPSLLWMAIIFYFSSQSTSGIDTGQVSRFLFFKSLHVIEYAILYLLLFAGLYTHSLSFSIGYLYALSDEFHQRFIPGREGKLSDTLIDTLGLLLGFTIFTLIVKITSKQANT